MSNYWWKAIGILCVLYSIILGFLGKVPELPILHETIRNLYFHVTMWFAMLIILSISIFNSIKFIAKSKDGFNLHYDTVAVHAASVGLLLGMLGIATGSVWANYTWGAPWTDDPKLNGAAAGILFYIAYFILRSSIDDAQKRARVSAIFNIFAYVMLIVFIMILPRLTDSLHPGNGGNPGFGGYDLDNNMRLVFYPAIIGWSLISWWIVTLQIRISNIKQNINASAS